MAFARHLMLGGAVALSMILSQGTAWAQLRVTVKSLTKPLAAQSCKASGDLNERGDAVVVCAFTAGSRRVPWYPFDIFGLYKTETWNSDRLVYWPASGGSRVLAASDKISVQGAPALSSTGDVYAAAYPVQEGGAVWVVDKAYKWTTSTTAGTVSPYQPPAGPELPIKLFLKQPADMLFLSDKLIARWQISEQGALTKVPDARPNVAEKLVNSGLTYYAPATGARLVYLGTAGGSFEGDIGEYQHWWGDGQRWQPIKTPQGVWPTFMEGMNASGMAVGLAQGLAPFVWDPSTGASTFLPGASEHAYTRLKINDLGTVAGHIQTTAPGLPDVPVVWWQGQVVDLNKVAKLPTNMVLTDIKAINNRNQLLVWAEDKTKPRNGRFMLLTIE